MLDSDEDPRYNTMSFENKYYIYIILFSYSFFFFLQLNTFRYNIVNYLN